MAKLALTIEKPEDVAEALRPLYVEHDGKWYLDADLPDTASLEAAAAEEKRLRLAAESAMRKAKQDADRLRLAKKAEDAGLTDERLAALREEAKAEVMAELEPKIKEAEAVKAQNRALTLDGVMKARALKGGLLPERAEDFWGLRAGEFDLTDDGKPMVKGKPGMDPDKHLAALLKRNPEWVRGSKGAGGGATGGAGTVTGASREDLVAAIGKNSRKLFDEANAQE